MPLYKQERKVTVYVEAESPSDLTWGTKPDLWDSEHCKFEIQFYSEEIGVAEEINQEELDEILNIHQTDMKCP